MRLMILFLLFSSCISAQQQHNDLKEFGYKGPVKQITVYHYDTSAIAGREEWSRKIIYQFNRSGNYDTIHYFYKVPYYGIRDSVYIHSMKNVFLGNGGNRSTVFYDDSGRVSHRQNYIWTSDSSYRIVATDKGVLQFEEEVTLAKDFREKSGKGKTYGLGKVRHAESFENRIDHNGFLVERITVARSAEEGAAHRERSVIGYTYSEPDRHGNPAKVIMTTRSDNKQHSGIVIREFEYY